MEGNGTGINHSLKCSRFYLLPEWQCPLPHWDNSGNCFLIPPIVVLVSGYQSPGKIKHSALWVHVNGMECYQDSLFPLCLLPSRPTQVISTGAPIQRPGASFSAVCSSKKFRLHRRFPSVQHSCFLKCALESPFHSCKSHVKVAGSKNFLRGYLGLSFVKIWTNFPGGLFTYHHLEWSLSLELGQFYSPISKSWQVGN